MGILGSPFLSEPYPRLLYLSIRNCPKLIKKLPTYLPSLVHLSIWECPQLVFPLERLPSLSKLGIQDCNEAVLRSRLELPSLTKLRIHSKLHEGYMLEIYKCDELTCLWENGFDGI